MQSSTGKMTTEQLDDARTLWKMFYACEAFRRAREACEFILTQNLDADHPAYYPLVTSIYVLYARPFNYCRGGIGKLTNDIVPDQHKNIHKFILNLRDQIFAHTDADEPNMDTVGSANQVNFVMTNGTCRLRLTQMTALPTELKNISILCKVLEEKTDYYVQKLWTRHLKLIPIANGEYTLNVKSIDQAFVSKMTPVFP
jgi:hypothetical protein